MDPLTPAKLIVALCLIPQGCTLVKNGVGNLAVFDAGIYIGFVDLRTGDLELDE